MAASEGRAHGSELARTQRDLPYGYRSARCTPDWCGWPRLGVADSWLNSGHRRSRHRSLSHLFRNDIGFTPDGKPGLGRIDQSPQGSQCRNSPGRSSRNSHCRGRSLRRGLVPSRLHGGHGPHYLPFSPLYGMRVFIPLGAGMWLAGLAFGLWRRPGRCRGGFHRGCLARRGGEGGGLQTRVRCPVRASLPGLSSLLMPPIEHLTQPTVGGNPTTC
jgi:hypothetical protein